MTVIIEGEYPALERVRTGLFSFDSALAKGGDLGLVRRTLVEFSGDPNVGKSTISYFMSGVAAQPDSKISVCDLEIIDRDYLASAVESSGYSGTVKIIASTEGKKKGEKFIFNGKNIKIKNVY